MKYFVNYLCILAGIFVVNSNCLGQQLISSAGGNYSDPEFVLSWSIGETLTSTLSNEEYVITQGLHQPNITITNIYENKFFENIFQVFPNPVNETLILSNTGYTNDFEVIVFNNLGEIVFMVNVHSDVKKKNISFENFEPGIYHLRIVSSTGKLLKRSKIVKI